MELIFRIRQTQYFAIQSTPSGLSQGDPIIYAGANPASLTPVYGVVPAGDNWLDITNYVTNLEKLAITWTTDRDIDGLSVAGAFQPKKTASNSVLIEGVGYKFIKDWLINNVAGKFNTIDVQIEHVGCGIYDEFVIKSTDIQWCEDRICEFSVTIKQKDPALQCVQQTLISDNWQEWFQKEPANGKKHPRFVYCNEVKPNGMMIMLWWLSSVIFTIVILLYIGIMPIVWIIQAIIGVILTIIDVISWLFGGSPEFDDNFNFTDPNDFLGSLGSFYVESSGCGRLHPAPLIRDYIDNVCQKCGVKVDPFTDPIFHSRTINIETSSNRGVIQNRDNPHYNATYFNAPIKRGIRIFNGLFSNDENTTDYYIQENRPVLALDQFLDEIKSVYNAEWRLINVGGEPTLYFWRKDWYEMGTPIFDFVSNEDDKAKLLHGICFSWNEIQQFAYMRGLYSEDASDTCGNEALAYMNDIIGLGDSTNNPTFDGNLDKRSQYFGGTRFRLDGVSRDYICDAMQVVLNGAALNPTIPAIMKNFVVPAIKKYADYALLLQGENCVLSKILIWDEGSGYEFAKSVRTHTTFPNGSPLPLPEPNSYYNPSGLQWYMYNFPETHVVGSSLSFGSSPVGRYTVQEYFGIDFYANNAEIVNYPMFFRSQFKDTLFDWFHWIDDPRISPRMNMEFDLKIELCCEDLQRLEVFGDASRIKLMDKVILPTEYFQEGTIREITVSYDSEDEYGKFIQLKGIL